MKDDELVSALREIAKNLRDIRFPSMGDKVDEAAARIEQLVKERAKKKDVKLSPHQKPKFIPTSPYYTEVNRLTGDLYMFDAETCFIIAVLEDGVWRQASS